MVKCQFEGCNIGASYGIDKISFCAKHRSPLMRDFKNKPCEFPNCSKQATYNIIGVKPAKYCYTHKQIGMCNVKFKKCVVDNCIKIARQGY